jgi:hypothetical protein
LASRGISINNTISTDFISPLSQDLVIKLASGSSKLEIQNASGSAVASIDNLGNANFNGKLTANQLLTNDATISGTLYAHTIRADQILGLNASSSSIVNNYYISTPSGTASGSSYLAYYNATESGTLQIPAFNAQIANINNINAATATFTQGLMAFGPSSLYDLSVADQLSVGAQLVIADKSINVLGADLQIQPLRQGGVDFLAGLVKIDVDGNLSVSGNATFAKNVSIQGILSANILSSFYGGDLTLKLNGSSADGSPLQHLSVKNSSNSSVFTITSAGDFIASGAGTFNKLNLTLFPKALALSSTEVIATGSAGVATVSAHQSELTINNTAVTDKSLIYITPRSDTGNNSLFLMRQVPGVSFTVGHNIPSVLPIPFNWIIVN